MCLVIAHFPEDSDPTQPVFVLGENRDDAPQRKHTENHITDSEAWPSVGERQTWIGANRKGCIALLNFYPEKEYKPVEAISRGVIVPNVLEKLGSPLEEILDLRNFAPFQLVSYSKERHELLWQVWDGVNLSQEVFESCGTHIFTSSSYGNDVATKRRENALDLVQGESKLWAEKIHSVLGAVGHDGTPVLDTPCMRGPRSETIGSHIIEVRSNTITLSGFAGSPHDPESQSAKFSSSISA